jgi:hypothetical protein
MNSVNEHVVAAPVPPTSMAASHRATVHGHEVRDTIPHRGQIWEVVLGMPLRTLFAIVLWHDGYLNQQD